MDKEIIIAFRKAMKAEDMETVKDIIEKNPDLLKEMTVLGTPLHDAARNGKYKVVKYLIEKGADVNADEGKLWAKPIVCAVSSGKIEIVKLLYENGAVLDVSTPEGNPLFRAIPDNNVEIAKFLIDYGIDITAKYDIGDIDGCDAMEYARQWGSMEIYEYLKEKMSREKSCSQEVQEALENNNIKITGTNTYIDVEIGERIVRIYGEMIAGGFACYKDSIKTWLIPFDEPVTEDEKATIIQKVTEKTKDSHMVISFE